MGDELQVRRAVAGDVDPIAQVVNVAFRRAESFLWNAIELTPRPCAR